jgi:hypothetical protein
MYLRAYLYRPKQLRDYLATRLEPLKIVFRLKCWLLGFHNFGVGRSAKTSLLDLRKKENGAW